MQIPPPHTIQIALCWLSTLSQNVIYSRVEVKTKTISQLFQEFLVNTDFLFFFKHILMLYRVLQVLLALLFKHETYIETD